MAKQLKKSKSISEIRKENGVLNYINDDIYEGEYSVNVKQRQLERNGFGTYTTWDGHTYSGQWINDILSDEEDVKIQYPDKSSFEGTVSPELKYVKGIYTFQNESRIIGEFKNNSPIEAKTEFIDKTNKNWIMTVTETELILKPPVNFFDYAPDFTLTESSSSEDENGEEAEIEVEETQVEKTPKLKTVKNK